MNTVTSTVNKLIRDNDFDFADFIVGMSRGGLIPAAMIATRLNKPLVAIYIDKKDNIYLDRKDWTEGKNSSLLWLHCTIQGSGDPPKCSVSIR